MRRVARKGLATVMVTSGMLAAAAGYAHADSGAEGAAAGSPGVLSGNAVQVPVHVPVNVCGNTVNVVGLLNPAAGNRCSNDSHRHTKGSQTSTSGGASAQGKAEGSPGVLSGNHVQVPVDVPVNVSGNSVNVVGIGNSAVGNSSSNHSGKHPDQPRASKPPTALEPAASRKPAVQHAAQTAPQQSTAALAETGADVTGFALPTGAGLLLGGIVLYRRFRPARP